MIALVTGIAIAAFDVEIFDFCKANLSSSATLSGFSKTEEPSAIPSNLWTKNLSNTHWFALLLDTWAKRISLGVNSTPTISSPFTADFPILFFKNLSKNPRNFRLGNIF